MKPNLALYILLSLLISQIFGSCQSGKKTNKINIFAAASLKDVLTETSKIYKHKTGIDLSLNFASSGILARQIEQGAEVDFFFSANSNWINYILKQNLLDTSSILELAQNKMALIVPNSSELKKIDSLQPEQFLSLFENRIAIGDPNHVPAGKYAKEILKFNKIWNSIKARILPCKNARETLLMVEMTEVEMGIVYLSDAIKSKKVRCVYEFNETNSSPILYYSAHRTNPNSKIRNFQVFLKQKESKQIWKDFEFIVYD